MWFHFLQLRSALNISSALRQVVHGTRWHAKRKSYKVLFWREITPLAVPIFMENACVLLMGVLSTFLVSWLGKDAMAGVGLADSFNMVIMAFSSPLIWDLLSLWHLVSVVVLTTSEGGDAAVIGDHDVVCRTVGNAYSSFWRTNY